MNAPLTNPGPALPLAPIRRSARHWLRLASFGLALLVVTMAAGLTLSGRPLFPHLFGDDLIPSYMAGTFVRQGRADLLMDYPAAERFQAGLRRADGLEQHGRTGPWLNPPFYALPFAALSALPYRAALWTWFGVNLAMLGASVVLLYRILPSAGRRPGDAAVVAVLLTFSMPALQAMACQQNTFLSLLLLSGAVALGRGGRAGWAGAVAGLLAFKPQLAVIVWLTLAATLGWRAVAGAAATAGGLGLLTLLAVPGALEVYLAKLPAALPHLRANLPYPWERQVTLQGFFRLLFQGKAGGPALPIVALLGWLGVLVAGAFVATMLAVAWRRRRSRAGLTPAARDRATAAAVAAMPLLMPYYMDYDLLLLAVPAVLLAAGRLRGKAASRESIVPDRAPATLTLPPRGVVASATTSARPSDHVPDKRTFHNVRSDTVGTRLLACGWAALFAWLFLNAAVADATGVSLTVPLLAAVAGGMIWRALSARSECPEVESGVTGEPALLAATPLRVAA